MDPVGHLDFACILVEVKKNNIKERINFTEAFLNTFCDHLISYITCWIVLKIASLEIEILS